jgi:hypothetical protein
VVTYACSESQLHSGITCQTWRLYTLFVVSLPTKTCIVLPSGFPMRSFSNGLLATIQVARSAAIPERSDDSSHDYFCEFEMHS